MRAAFHYLTSGRFLWMLGLAGCIGWGIGFVSYHVAARQIVMPDGNVLGRDFMAFYVAGTLIRQNQGHQLYDDRAQSVTQAQVLGRYGQTRGGFIGYVNPASVAVACSLLARLGYLTAFFVHTALMLSCFIGGMWLLRQWLANLAGGWAAAVMVSLLFFPMTQAITGGQNAALSFLLVVLAFRSAMRHRQAMTGLALGLLLYKPQYALPLLGLLLLRRQWITVAVAGLLGVGHYLLGAACCGWDWPMAMKAYLDRYYNAQELLFNGHTHISITVALEYWLVDPLIRAGAPMWLTTGLKAVGYLLVAAIVVYLIWRWRRAKPGHDEFGLYWSLVVSASLSISPHTQYYDAALLILPVLLMIDHRLRPGCALGTAERVGLLVGHLGGFSYSLARWLHFQPLVFWPLAVFVWIDGQLRGRADHSAQ